VAGKGVYGQHVEVLRRLPLQRQARISQHDVHVCSGGARIRQISEFRLRDYRDQWIDVIECVVIAASGEGGGRSCSQADDADTLGGVRLSYPDRQADPAARAIVRNGLAMAFRTEKLLPMLDRAMYQAAGGVVRALIGKIAHLERAIKVPHHLAVAAI